MCTAETLSLLVPALAYCRKRRQELETAAGSDTVWASVADAAAGSSTSRKQQVAKQVSKEVPKIYFASRTHSQIAGVIKQLKKTAFAPTMTILGAREHYCIHGQVSRQSDKNEACARLLENNSCSHFQNFHSLQKAATSMVWDIEVTSVLSLQHMCDD